MRHNLSVPGPGRVEGIRDRGRSATDIPDVPRAGASPEEGAPAPAQDADAV
jgi:probable phosphoglycerate mutase